MRCSRIREAVSARLDGEDAGVPAGRVDAHLATCPDCRAWAAAAGSLPAALAAGQAPADGVTRAAPDPAVVAALLAEAADAPPRRPALVSVGELRIVLAVLAVFSLVTAWPGVLPFGHAAEHIAHELRSWDIGLAVGFLFLAWQPSRAWGALPLVAVLVACLTGASVLDLVSGAARPARESVHLLEVAGLGCLWMLARQVPRQSVVVRLA